MKSDRGCDGGCVVNEAMYKEIMNTIRNHIMPPVTTTRPKRHWINIDKTHSKCDECDQTLKNYLSMMIKKSANTAYMIILDAEH